ncbi:D-alanyl-D-alanine carboxypeptidase [Streptomyces caeni]|uniref:serine-type D-Ala-D-Ala carboxypeptidase n=1 Tax=Streptomyces caeni TaxID=2307231 RepID=A0ABW4IVF5_9ACTN
MAGESPDRSKQHESPVEPASGSGAPVPEPATAARDPRLELAGEKTRADRATAVFSTRALREAQGAARSAAGAAGAGGVALDDAERAEDAAEDVAAEGAAEDVAAEGAEAGSGSGSEASAADGASGESQPDGEQEAASGEAEGEVDSEAEAEAEGEGEGEGEGERPAFEAAPEDEPAAEEEPEDEPEGEPTEEPEGEPRREADASGAEGAPKPPVDQPTAVFKAVRPPAVDQPTTMLKLGDAAPPNKARETGKADEKDKADVVPGKDEAADAPGGRRPGAPAADQPTTMLKLGAAKPSDKPSDKTPGKPSDKTPGKPSDKTPGTTDGRPAPAWAKASAPAEAKPGGPASGAKSPRKPDAEPPAESGSERTSRFVALKPLDEPAEPKPKSQAGPAEATTALPRVGPERTTQQPLPPKPPLDLLAELTNTPPPPATPVRTLVRRIKIWTPLVVLLLIVFAIVQAVRPLPAPTLALTAKDDYAFDGSGVSLPWPDEGQGWIDVNGVGTMGNFGKQAPVAIGSVAKAMTAYIVLRDHPFKTGQEGAKITVDATAEKEGGYDKDGESTLNTVKENDTLTEKQALSAIMIPSANNIARLLARWDAGSEAAFVKKMNDTAKSLGMTGTTYTDPSGLKETTVSTAEDQVKLGNELVKIPALMEITKLPSWKDPSGQKWQNYNRLVPYNGAIGIKTGTTTAAGGNLLFAATKQVGGESVTVVGAILGQHKAPIIDTVNAASKTAMLAARDAMTSAKILKKGAVVGYVDDGLGGRTPVVVAEDVTVVGWAGLRVKLSFAADDVPHTAKAGTRVGTLTVGDGGGAAVRVPVALQKDLTEPGYGAKFTRLG